ncbi:inner membrane protein [Escherichia coli]|nr:inner membrane protein [Escherichia coli]
MLWSFIAVCLSAWLSVDASYRGPTGNGWVFKPLTLLLLLLLAWQAPMFDAISYLVLAGAVRLTAGRCANPVATSTSDVRHRARFSSRTCCTPSISPVR